jgi:hypothetical protein
MADLGFRSVDEMIGHAEVLKPKFIAKGKAKSLILVVSLVQRCRLSVK